MKKNIFLLGLILTVIMCISCFGVILVSAETSEINPIDFNFIRKDQANTVQYGKDGNFLVVHGNSNQERMAFLKFDLTGIDINEVQSIMLKLITTSDVNNSGNKEMRVYLLAQEKESWDGSTITYSSAQALGITGVDSSYITSQVLSLAKETAFYTADIFTQIKAHLDENNDDKIISLKLAAPISTDPYLFYGTSSALVITYKGDTGDLEQIVQQELEALTFDKLTPEPSSAVTADLNLPTQGSTPGTIIRWTSSQIAVINPQNGMVFRPNLLEGDKAVTLTATIEYSGVSDSKSFEVTVLEGRTIPIADAAFIRSGRNADTVYGGASLVADGGSNDPAHNKRMIFVKINLTDYVGCLSELHSLSLRLTTTDEPVNSGKETVSPSIHLIPVDPVQWSSSNLTYNTADQLGMVNVAEDYLIYRGELLQGGANREFGMGNILSYIKEYIQQGGNPVITLRISYHDTAEAPNVYYGLSGNAKQKPALIAGFARYDDEYAYAPGDGVLTVSCGYEYDSIKDPSGLTAAFTPKLIIVKTMADGSKNFYIHSEPVNWSTGEVTEGTISKTIDYNGEEIKVMLWEDLSSIKPASHFATYSN